MIEPALSLAVSVYYNKGVYALLLGSGVSRSSGIPTGWEVVEDLIRKVAHLRKELCDPTPDVWFTRTFGGEANYSDVLDQIANSPAERLQVLRGYFEPTEEELAEGRTLPPFDKTAGGSSQRSYSPHLACSSFTRHGRRCREITTRSVR